MEPQSCCPSSTTSKKQWKMLRIVFSMLQKSVTKSKLFIDDLHINSWKTCNNLTICHPTTAPACGGSHDVQESFISPLHYEFSCSSSPPYRATVASKRRSFRHKQRRQHRSKGYTRFNAQPMFKNVDAVEDLHWNVDKAAEEFIDGFYKELMLQKIKSYSSS